MMSVLVNVSADLSHKCSGRHGHHSSSVTVVSRSHLFSAEPRVVRGSAVRPVLEVGGVKAYLSPQIIRG